MVASQKTYALRIGGFRWPKGFLEGMIKVRVTSQACWHFLVIPGTLGRGDRGIRSSRPASLHTKFGASLRPWDRLPIITPAFPEKEKLLNWPRWKEGSSRALYWRDAFKAESEKMSVILPERKWSSKSGVGKEQLAGSDLCTTVFQRISTSVL